MAPLLALARHADARRIAEIHMAAFGPNKMLHAQFPTPALRQALQDCIEKKVLADIDYPKTTVLVVRDAPDNLGMQHHEGQDRSEIQDSTSIMAFAKWSHPISDEEDCAEPPWIWPEGTCMHVLDAWTKQSEAAQMRAVGQTPSYVLTFMGTDPCYKGRGAASLLIRWGMDRCKLERVPAYVESTVEAAGLYAKHGFTAVGRLSLDITNPESREVETYIETSFTFNTTGHGPVTGSSRGIGAAIALRLAEEGADVVVNYVSSAALRNK
ncbi:hypothetical protein NUW58_g8221 [Xylaria curta]|uniref:Uncharacterized protein n=1 Tax=Xylaria curta TaxID=42375 RepID=A0ACC1N9J0_9PEZI|nr:hypothetical protein NUW58_g8221 [Xylaria curta]